MTDPAQNLSGAGKPGDARRFGAVDHQKRQTQFTRRINLGARACTARILRYDHVHFVVLYQSLVRRYCERATINDQAVIGHWNSVRRVNQTQNIMMLRLNSEFLQMHPPKRQHDAHWRTVQRRNSRLDIRGAAPVVARLRSPGRTGQPRQGDPALGTGLRRIPAHLCGKRMRCINQMGDLVGRNVGQQSVHAAKPTDPGWQRLFTWFPDAPRIGKHRIQATLVNCLRQRAGFGRATQYEKACGDG